MFTMRQMNRLESRIVEIVDEHLDAMEEAGTPADLVSSFALPIPSLVICELLGVPYADRDDFQRRSLRQLDMALAPLERQAVADESRSYMRSLVERARSAPGDDLIGTLVHEHGDEVSDEELAGIGALLLVAGHETTSNMLALGTVVLLQHPVQLAAVRDDPAAVGPAVEELLRFASVVQTAIPRITTTDVEIGGVVIPGGSLVLLSLPSANHDPRFIDAPDSSRHPSRRTWASGVRPRRTPLPRRTAGSHGDADRVSGIVTPVPRLETGWGSHRNSFQANQSGLRRPLVAGGVVRLS